MHPSYFCTVLAFDCSLWANQNDVSKCVCVCSDRKEAGFMLQQLDFGLPRVASVSQSPAKFRPVETSFVTLHGNTCHKKLTTQNL